MNTQKLFSVLFVAFFLSLALVSAAFTATPSVALTQFSNASTITLSPNITTISTSSLVLTGTSGNATVAITNAFNAITLTMSSFPNNLGTYTGSLLISNSTTDNQTIIVTYTKTLATSSNVGNLDVSIDDISVEEGFGDDESYWYPLDDVSVDVKIESPTYDVENIEITACLWDVSASECILDEEDMEISEDDFDLDEDDDLTITLTFNVDPDKLSEGNTDYELHVAASGDINTVSTDPNDGKATSDYDIQDNVEIRTDEQFVIASNIEVQEPVSCDSTFELSFDLWNIGDEDLDQDEVYLLVKSTDLGINQVIALEDDLNSMDSLSIVAPLKITKNVTLKSYSLTIEAYEDDSLADKYLYQNSEDDDASWTIPVKVSSCSAVSSNGASTITNVELSDQTQKAITGSQVIIETTVKNTGSLSATYTIDVSGNSQWSTVAEIDPKTFTLASGASQKVNVYLDVTGDAVTGEKEFTIKSTSGTTVSEQKVKINVEKGITSSAVINHFKTNWVVYTIVLVNLILIIAIILVVKSIASSKN